MTALLSRRRSKPTSPAAAAPGHVAEGADSAGEDLSHLGIHRDATAPDPIAAGSFAQRMVNKVSGMLGRSQTSRRSFLTRTAVVGSALAVGPLDFVLKPGTAYGYLCGTCTDGWTAFCCTINSGRNSCPAGSFVAGWWKADNAAYCCGSARYIIDCNATCPTQCSCRCGGGSCDNRRTCCNQFRYGQCNTQIACYGPVVCRVAICTPPWNWDPSCTTTVRTDNRTTDHGAPCLSRDCGPASTPISRKYEALGGAGGYLGPVRERERDVRGNRPGRVARYRSGDIYWSSATGAHPVWGRLLTEFRNRGGIGGTLGYPSTDILTTPDRRAKYSIFQYGRIYSMQDSNRPAVTVTNAFHAKHAQMGGVRGHMGYPTANARAIRTPRGGQVQVFEKGRMFRVGGTTYQTHGSIDAAHQANGGIGGSLGYPTSDVVNTADGNGRTQRFERGQIWSLPSAGIGGQALFGVTLQRYRANGDVRGYLGYPTRGTTNVGDGRGTRAEFQRGHIYGTPPLGAFQIHGAVLTFYLAQGGPTGSLGYPTTELDPQSQPGNRFQSFENGRIVRRSDGTIELA